MGIAVHPLGNWDQKSELYLLGFLGFIHTHSFTNRMAKSGSSENAPSVKVDETGTPSSREQRKVGRDSI